jgi:putative tryptophan/tyrosine transport system substrate-binding protein
MALFEPYFVLAIDREAGMRRREFVQLAAGNAITWPLAARAQQKVMPVIGLLHFSPPGPFEPFLAALRQGLSEVGYVEGQNLAIEYRWAESHYDRLPALAADLVGRKVDVIVASGGTAVALAAKATTSTIPVVFIIGGDPVGDGLVASLARPAGNLTGFTIITIGLVPKLLELLSEIVPQAGKVTLLANPGNPVTKRIVAGAQEAARAKGVQLSILEAGSESEINAAFASLVDLQAKALLVGPDPVFFSHREQLVSLAARNAVPAIYPSREFAASGGLCSYGVSITAIYRQVGGYAGRILKGEKPADLPVQQPDKFELVINLTTAKALGLTIPQSVLQRADEVIE